MLIVADSLRWDAVHGAPGGVAGGGLSPPPQDLPACAARGATFLGARAAGCWTVPATASMFTGLLPHEHGADAQTRGLRRDLPTLAERMDALGYRPHQVTANPTTTDVFGLDRGFRSVQRAWSGVPAHYRRMHEALVLLGRPRLRTRVFAGDWVAGRMADDLDAAKTWLQSLSGEVFDRARAVIAEEEAQGHGTFLFLNLMETHFPYHVAATFETTADGPVAATRELWALFHLVNQTWLTTGRQPGGRAAMAALQARQRLAWRRLAPALDAFAAELHDAGCLVVVCSDHGETFGDGGWYYHFSNVTEAGTRTMLQWLSPDGRHARRRVETPVCGADIFHGLLHEAGAPDAAFHPVETPERSLPVVQSTWYDRQGRTLPAFRANQLAFLHDDTRWRLCRGRWSHAPAGDDEAGWTDLDPGTDPLEEGRLGRERLPRLREIRDGFVAYGERVGGG